MTTTMTPRIPVDEESDLRTAIAHYQMEAAVEHLKDSLREAELVATGPGDQDEGDPGFEEVSEFFLLLFRELTESADSDPLRAQFDDFRDRLATATHSLAHVLQAVADVQGGTSMGRFRAKKWIEESAERAQAITRGDRPAG